MRTASIIRLEANLDRAASALFAGACAFAACVWLAGHVAELILVAESAAAGVFAYMLCVNALAAVKSEAGRLKVPIFDVRELGAPELLLTETYEAADARREEPLMLDDILAELGPDSRVVRLFDPAAMPTPAELQSRIDEHLERGQTTHDPSEAVEALHAALAELRQSLR